MKSIILLQSFMDKPLARIIWKAAGKHCTTPDSTAKFLNGYEKLVRGIKFLLSDIDEGRDGNHGYLSVMTEEPPDTLAVGHLMQYLPGLKAFMAPNEVKRLHANAGRFTTQHKPDKSQDTKYKSDKPTSKSQDKSAGRGGSNKRGGDKASKDAKKTSKDDKPASHYHCYNCKKNHKAADCPEPCKGPSLDNSIPCPGGEACQNKSNCARLRRELAKRNQGQGTGSLRVPHRQAQVRVKASKGERETRPILDYSIGATRVDSKLLIDTGASDGVASSALFEQARQEYPSMSLLSLNQKVEVELVGGIITECIGVMVIPKLVVHLPNGEDKEFLNFHCAIYEGNDLELIMGNNILQKVIGIDVIALLTQKVEASFNCARAGENLGSLVLEEELSVEEVISNDPGLESLSC